MKMLIKNKKEKIWIFVIYTLLFLFLLFNFTFANSYSNNSISIEVNPQKRTYDYKDEINIEIKIENKNRYAKLHYKIKEIYTGGGFNALNLLSEYQEIEPLKDTKISVTMHDNFINERPETPIDTHITFKDGYQSRINKYNIGHHAYEITKEEFEELKKFRKEKNKQERLSSNEDVGRLSKEKENFTRGANATLLIILIIVLVCIFIIIFVCFIVKAKSKGGSKYLSIFIILGLLALMINQRTYASNTYIENIIYNKEVNTRCTYWDLDCSFTVKVEYYFENVIAEVTDLTLDSDNDNLPDYLEILYLTDLNNKDTDSDGIPDGDEVHFTYTDPMREDTDNNSILDGDEDFDKDGLTNIEEYNNGTQYDLVDTDFDSISDYDEVNGIKTQNGLRTYTLDPTNEDTDGDGLRDDVELKLNLNPNDPYDANTKVNQILSDSVLPKNLTIESAIPITFKGELVGDIDENVSAKISSDSYFDSLQYIIGIPIVITTKYVNADGLKIVYDLTKYSSIKSRISIYRWESGELVEVPGFYLSGNSLISNCYSGIYVLIDSNAYIQDLNIFIN
ncbi:MAG: hypothetical protein Q4F88_05145 [Eubacteriales bacterium]|nr:hypothetical protein [Eubacteriales bacterium]